MTAQEKNEWRYAKAMEIAALIQKPYGRVFAGNSSEALKCYNDLTHNIYEAIKISENFNWQPYLP